MASKGFYNSNGLKSFIFFIQNKHFVDYLFIRSKLPFEILQLKKNKNRGVHGVLFESMYLSGAINID